MDLRELENGIDPDGHWYYQAKKIRLEKYFKKISSGSDRKWTILDFGAGSGFFSLDLLKSMPEKIEKVLLVDTGYELDEINVAKGKVTKLHDVPKKLNFTLVIMMDVLEHIEDDLAVLDIIRERSAKEVYYFITVPAFQSLWSSHDVYLKHFRRYTIKSLEGVLGSASYEIARSYYAFGLIFPLAWLIRRLNRKKLNAEQEIESSDMKPLAGSLNAILLFFNSLEMQFSPINKLAGLSCVSEGKI